MDALARTAAALRTFGAEMKPDLPRIDEALPAVRALLRDAGVPFKIVGGLAVIHHGYERYTRDVDVLVPRDGMATVEGFLEAHGFSKVSERRLRHDATGVFVDMLPEGAQLRGLRPAPPLPSPNDVSGSASDAEVVALPALLEFKLDAGRLQDLADVVQLLKKVDETNYVYVEAAVRSEHRPELAGLRDQALQELEWDRMNGGT